MKDSVVGAAGALHPRRVKRLTESLRNRRAATEATIAEMSVRHGEQSHGERIESDRRRTEQTERCRRLRREMLDRWDRGEEEITAKYEAEVVAAIRLRNQSAVVLRRQAADQEKTIQRKVDSRRQAVLQQYENRKNQPGRQSRTEMGQIDDALRPLGEQVQWAKSLTMRRLNALPEVGRLTPEEIEAGEVDPMPTRPRSVKESLDKIAELSRQGRREVAAMQRGAASKTVDSFYLPAATAVFVAVWMIAAAVFAEQNKFIWIFAGIPIAMVIAFAVYLVLLMPLRRMTRQIYPRVERIWRAAEATAAAGRDISRATAESAKSDLVRRRTEHLDEAARWREEQSSKLRGDSQRQQAALTEHHQRQMASLTSAYREGRSALATEMRAGADRTAEEIQSSLSSLRDDLQKQQDASEAERTGEADGVRRRLQRGQFKAASLLRRANQRMHRSLPDWQVWLDGSESVAPADQGPRGLDFVPLGWLRGIGPAAASDGAGDSDSDEVHAGDADSTRVPLVLHRRLASTVVIDCDDATMDAAVSFVQAALWRLLMLAGPGAAELTLVDPAGRGQHFTPLMSLADDLPSLISSRVWTEPPQIEEQFSRLSRKIEDVLHTSLRDRFERIEDYNRMAGSLAVRYRAVAAVGLPAGLTSRSAELLRAISDASLRCGVMLFLVRRRDPVGKDDLSLPDGEHVIRLDVRTGDAADPNAEGSSPRWTMSGLGWDDVDFEPIEPPPPTVRGRLAQRIGQSAVAAANVEVPLESILDGVELTAQSSGGEPVGQSGVFDGVFDGVLVGGQRDSRGGLSIPIGSQGAGRTLSLELGHGMAQHVLIAGKTGSGKSSLLHSIITSGAYHYAADQLQFYLLDFKKGVELKRYADAELPHARVIGIESEREFGRSVLESLDRELQRRGEAFRAASAASLSDYRDQTGAAMPRVMLVVDEFQELFVRDDRLAADCTMLLDRLVRQGRSFGMHVVLASQSLAGTSSLPRATIGQMAVRIAMQCGESDAALILSDDNPAAKPLSHPGQAIYNDAGGLIEGNRPVQIALVRLDRQVELCASIRRRDASVADALGPATVFEGNRPADWHSTLAKWSAVPMGEPGEDQDASHGRRHRLVVLLGESVDLGPPTSLTLERRDGRNVLLVGPASSRSAVLSSICQTAMSHGEAEVVYFEGGRGDDANLSKWLCRRGSRCRVVPMPEAESVMIELAESLGESLDRRDEDARAKVIVLDPLGRFRQFKGEETYSFSFDGGGGSDAMGGSAALRRILSDGPAVGMHVVLGCDQAETVTRFLSRSALRDLELRILGRVSASDSSLLIETPAAGELSPATMLLHDDADGRGAKFRVCGGVSVLLEG